MALHLTPEILEAVYELLRVTPPFRGWKLPHADEVRFKVGTGLFVYGQHTACGQSDHEIMLSKDRHETLPMVILTMAHEMVHMHQAQKGNRDAHGEHFRRYAAQVCRHHGFDAGAF